MDAGTFQRIAAEERPRLLGLAYRMTGSFADAEDLVQEALLRLHRSAPEDLASPGAYLTTVTTRLAIDHLDSARVRRETYPGPWLPQPICADPSPDASERALLTDTISIAFLLILETLNPHERAVLVLHDVFAFTHPEIAAILDRTEASSRQLLRRARQRLEERRPRIDVDPGRHDEVVRRFIAACDGGDLDALLATLTSDVELVFDGGPDIRTAARRPIRGADRAARFLAYVMQRIASGRRIELATLNGESAALIHAGRAGLVGAVFVEVADGRVGTIRWIRNPTKLRHLQPGPGGSSGSDRDYLPMTARPTMPTA